MSLPDHLKIFAMLAKNDKSMNLQSKQTFSIHPFLVRSPNSDLTTPCGFLMQYKWQFGIWAGRQTNNLLKAAIDNTDAIFGNTLTIINWLFGAKYEIHKTGNLHESKFSVLLLFLSLPPLTSLLSDLYNSLYSDSLQWKGFYQHLN